MRGRSGSGGRQGGVTRVPRRRGSPALAGAPVGAGLALGVPVRIAAAEGAGGGLVVLVFAGVALLLSALAEALLVAGAQGGVGEGVGGIDARGFAALVVEAFEREQGDFLPDEFFDGDDLVGLLRGGEHEGVAVGLGAADRKSVV